MQFLMIVKVTLNKPFAHWAAAFDADAAPRAANGVETVFRHPVIGEQAAVFAMRTSTPRPVHDMMYHPAMRASIEDSGLVIGSEQILVCDAEA